MLKKHDILFFTGLALIFFPFLASHKIYAFYTTFNHDHGFFTAFLKFAILATLGELIGLRIKTGFYYKSGFGVLPRAIVWGFLGLTIKYAFIIFASGTPAFLEYMGMKNAATIFHSTLSLKKLIVSFTISAGLNLIYAPVMMTLHKITDTHIITTGGTIKGFFTPIPVAEILKNLNWDVQWNFVFKKTIPFFWIPAHTITFLLPDDFRVLFAALLGIVLGIILAFANQKTKHKKTA